MSCCHDDACAAAPTDVAQRRLFMVVLAINAAMFFIEFGAGWLIGSAALLGDSLDMFGDAVVYAVSLYVVGRGSRALAASARLKGGLMVALGLFVLAEAVRRALVGVPPEAVAMSGIALLALAMNALCFVLLTRRRDDDVNVRSAWICSRNDLVANVSVLAAAGLVAVTGSAWPDVIVGAGIAALFLNSARGVFRDARAEAEALA